MRVPTHWLRHTVIVEPFAGQGGDRALYGPPVAVRCHLEAARESQRRGSDRGPGDSTMGIAQVEHAEVLRLDSRVTVDGRVVEVRSVRVRTFPGGPVPEHIEFVFA